MSYAVFGDAYFGYAFWLSYPTPYVLLLFLISLLTEGVANFYILILIYKGIGIIFLSFKARHFENFRKGFVFRFHITSFEISNGKVHAFSRLRSCAVNSTSEGVAKRFEKFLNFRRDVDVISLC